MKKIGFVLNTKAKGSKNVKDTTNGDNTKNKESISISKVFNLHNDNNNNNNNNLKKKFITGINATNTIQTLEKEVIKKELIIPLPNQEKKNVLLSNVNHISIDDKEIFKKDLASRPEEISFKSEKYEKVPVEEFGAAILRGMGWNGKINENTESINDEITPRHYRLGLGATPNSLVDKNKNKNKKRKVNNELDRRKNHNNKDTKYPIDRKEIRKEDKREKKYGLIIKEDDTKERSYVKIERSSSRKDERRKRSRSKYRERKKRSSRSRERH